MNLTVSQQSDVFPEVPVQDRRAQDPRWDRDKFRRWAGWLLVAYLVPLSALVLSARLTGTGLPQLADSLVLWSSETGFVAGLRFGHVEALANIAVFTPIGFLMAGLWGRRAGARHLHRFGMPDWAVWLTATALSVAIELTQLFLLTERSGTLRDLACNSTGALAGVAVHRIIQAARQRDKTRRTS